MITCLIQFDAITFNQGGSNIETINSPEQYAVNYSGCLDNAQTD